MASELLRHAAGGGREFVLIDGATGRWLCNLASRRMLP
jgi:hypothetical protein